MKFQYVDVLPKLFKLSGLAFGSAMHSALAWFHKEKMTGNGITLERLYKIFDSDWYHQLLEGKILFEESCSGSTSTVFLLIKKKYLPFSSSV